MGRICQLQSAPTTLALRTASAAKPVTALAAVETWSLLILSSSLEIPSLSRTSSLARPLPPSMTACLAALSAALPGTNMTPASLSLTASTTESTDSVINARSHRTAQAATWDQETSATSHGPTAMSTSGTLLMPSAALYQISTLTINLNGLKSLAVTAKLVFADTDADLMRPAPSLGLSVTHGDAHQPKPCAAVSLQHELSPGLETIIKPTL